MGSLYPVALEIRLFRSGNDVDDNLCLGGQAMVLGYLINPALQVEDVNGKPLTGGFLRVYHSGTTIKYITDKNFTGDKNPFEVVLDNKGMAVLLADVEGLYDVYCYDKNGVEQWSRLKVKAGYGVYEDSTELLDWFRGIGSTVVDTNVYKPGTPSGTMEMGTYGPVLQKDCYYHATVHVRATKADGTREPYYDNINLNFKLRDSQGNVSAVATATRMVDYSTSLSQEFEFSCDTMPEADSELILVINGQDVLNGAFEIVDIEVHRVYSGAPVIPGGIVTKEQVQQDYQRKLTAGNNINITNNVISAADQQQSDWTQSDSSAVDYIKHKPSLATVATSGNYNDLSNKPNLSNYATTSQLATKQDTLIAGANITIVDNVISATGGGGGGGGGTTYTAGEGISIDANNEISAKVDGTTITVNASGELEAIGGGSGSQVQANWAETDPSDPSYIENKPSIPTATSDLTNDSGYITSSDVPAAQEQADWNESNSSDPAYIKNKPSIPAAQVNADWNASSGVAQILNKPTIPSATSDLTNDSGFITSSDVPSSQAQADWNESDSSDPSYIKNKPTIPSAVTVDQTYNSSSTNAQSGTAVAGALATVNQVPASTSSDEDKVLTVNSSGNPVWAPAQGSAQVQSDWTESDTTDPAYIQNKPTTKSISAGSGISITESSNSVVISATGGGSGTVDQTYNASSTNAQSGTAVAGALATVNQVPASTSSDEDKVLTVNSSGTPVWAAAQGGAQVQSDWTELDTTDPSYIQNKPTEKSLVAGTNVAITSDSSSVTISATDTTYTAGTGIDITNNAISVETPVDVVAGPGIVIDNPDGNTMRISTDENYETVLWSGTLNTLNSNIECSENLSNFSTIKIFYRLVADSAVQSVGVHEFEPSEMSSGQNVSFGGFYLIANNFYGWWIGRLVVTDGYKVKITNTKNSWGTGNSPSDGTTNYSTVGFIYKIVGVRRIANN